MMLLKTGLLLVLMLPQAAAKPVMLCDISMGFALLAKKTYSTTQMDMILRGCDTVSPTDPKVLLLHGLVERNKALVTGNFSTALVWIQKAHDTAPDNQGIRKELAVTYELMHDLPRALATYQSILNQDNNNRAALLGEANIYRLQKQFDKAIAIYQHFLNLSSHDIDALNGLAFVRVSQKNLLDANTLFLESIKIRPGNQDALRGLSAIKNSAASQVNALCNVKEGFRLLNKNSPATTIQSILQACEKNQFDTVDTRLLRGLLARQQHHYEEAIRWLQKAIAISTSDNKNPLYELAITYEWAKQPEKAQTLYEYMLASHPQDDAALQGKARSLRAQNQLAQAQLIYEQLLKKKPDNIEARNGMGFIAIARKQLAEAKRWFESSIQIQANNAEARLGLKDVLVLEKFLTGQTLAAQAPPVTTAPVPPKPLCDANEGLILLNKQASKVVAAREMRVDLEHKTGIYKPTIANTSAPVTGFDFVRIDAILKKCDKTMPNDTATLMLHALLARYQAREGNQDYQKAIAWFELAVQSAESNNKTPLIELAVTYEWAGESEKALAIYQYLLRENPQNTIALMGEARALRSLYKIQSSIAIYDRILQKNPNNVEALNGLGETLLSDYDLRNARIVFNQVLTLDPDNQQTKIDREVLNNTTNNILGITAGRYAVPPKTSDGLNLYYFRNLNATDSLTIFAMHNNRQIESGFGLGPTLLPNNSVLLGYQSQIPNKYGFELSYDARQHNDLPFEHRVYTGVNFFLNDNIQAFSALRLIVPFPWNTELFISGLTLYTDLPVNVSVTGFWAYQEVGGKSSAYALDFSKEFANRFFYDIGPSYLPVQNSWEVHGRLILPILTNQALVAEYSHYFFNNSTFATAGWRFYWGV